MADSGEVEQDTKPWKYGFKSIQLLKSETLGIGSYGSVCKALCDDLLCAAKIIHPTLFDLGLHVACQRKSGQSFGRFENECQYLSAIKHPNIVQYLGTHQDPETGLPVLLMELMDDCLTHFLESSQDAIPYHIQVYFCHDITKAISYLHSNGITHRDLSSNNVLLCGNVKAKVTDFGKAKLGDIKPQATRVSFVIFPSTDAYMSPETVKNPAVYTAKTDCFAIGTLIIQILTRCFPEPGDRLKIVHTTDPRFPTIEARASEIERRQNHISQVDPNHPLLPIALHCLKDSDVERPSARELCHRVAALKETPQFTESVRRAQERPEPGNTTEREEEIRELQSQLQSERQRHSQQLHDIVQEKDDIIHEQDDITKAKDEEIVQLKQQVTQASDKIKQRDQLIEEKETTLDMITQQLEMSKHTIDDFQAQIKLLQQQLSETEHSNSPTVSTDQLSSGSDSSRETRRRIELGWREAENTLCVMARGTDAVVCGDTLYLHIATMRIAYAFDSNTSTWSQLPDCPTINYSFAVVNHLLTAIGGTNKGEVTNQLFSLIGEGSCQNWTETYPPMPTKRWGAATVSDGKILIVAGGWAQGGLTVVEVMNIATKQWSTAASLPGPIYAASATICDNRVYILGGLANPYTPVKSVYTCSPSALLINSVQSKSFGARLARTLSLNSPSGQLRSTIWDRATDLPVTYSTCVTVCRQLLAIGGRNVNRIPTSAVHMYHTTTNTWEIISNMNVSRYECFAAVLSANRVMVVGGYTTELRGSETDSVELATVM